MPNSESQSGSDALLADVLTLAEAAAYLRVSEKALQALVNDQFRPGQRIGDEWRFSKAGLADWLRYGHFSSRALKMFPDAWMFGHLPIDELEAIIEKRRLAPSGSAERPEVKPEFPSILSTPNVCGGSPRLVRTRIPIWVLQRMRQLRFSESKILESYPTLTAADLVQAWGYAAMHKAEIEKEIEENERE